jgi:hypothetical protein
MSAFRTHKILAVVIAIALLVPACGPSQEQEAVIATAVALTVQAGAAPTETATLPPATPTLEMPGTEMTLTPAITPTNTQAAISAPADPDCVKATLVSENPPDKVQLNSGEYFWKTWTIQNVGTCTWTTAYKLVFTSGDRLGSSISYALPDDVAPNETTDISIYLQAPETEGTFTGYWRIETPWGGSFGVGQYSQDIYAQIVVSDARKPKYGVTNVTYELVRNPPMGCPTNVRFTVYATISVDGPIDVDYRWMQSDGNESGSRPLDFTEAGSKTVSREWMIGKGDSPNPRWMQIVILEPKYQEWDQVTILNVCP